MPRTRQETPEGIEMQFATNVLGYFRLIEALTDRLKVSAPARIVNVASYWAGGLDLNDLGFGGHKTLYQGTDMPVRLATQAAAGSEISGRYYEYRREGTCSYSRTDKPSKRSIKLVGYNCR